MSKAREAAENFVKGMGEPMTPLMAALIKVGYLEAWNARGREDQAICEEIELRGRLEGVPQPGALSARIKIRQLDDQGGVSEG